jgi:pimeloyl-ACP methyl ester carboxylesterase
MVRGILIGLAVFALAIASGVYIFSDPDLPAAALETKYAPAPSKFLSLPSGARVHYRDRGVAGGETLLLLHGTNASLHTWEPWVERLAGDLRIVTIDMPGHGLTGSVPGDDYSPNAMAAFVGDLAASLGLEKFSLGGHSMGGRIAARFAIDNPAKVNKLILVDAGGMPSNMQRDPGIGLRLARIPVINNLMRWVSPRAIFESNLKTAIFNDALVTPEMVDLYWELNRREGNRAASLRRFRLPDDDYLQKNAKRIVAPVLLLWGERDPLQPADVGEAYRAAIPNALLVVYKNTGHFPHEEVPDLSAADVKGFLTGNPIPSVPTN